MIIVNFALVKKKEVKRYLLVGTSYHFFWILQPEQGL